MPDLEIRQLEGLDPQTLATLTRLGHQALGESALGEWMLPVIADCGLLFVGVAGGEIVGAAEILRCAREGELYLEGFYIAPPHQGRGHGRALLSSITERLAQEGYLRLLATVDPENDAGRRLYAAAGFRESGELPDHYGPGRHRLSIELELGADAGRAPGFRSEEGNE